MPSSLPLNGSNETATTGSNSTSTSPLQQQQPSDDTSSSSLHETLKTLAGVAGNVLELYDFAVFGYFSDILGQVFFPPNQPGNVALIESFAVFGGAFVMRPIGGILMGHLGDLYGRKCALEVSIFLMAVPTFLMGCLPTYAQAGAWSYIALIVIRLLQGLSVGGQLMSSLVYTLERKPKKQWGLYGSYVMATGNFGTLLGGVVGYWIRSVLDEDQVLRYGWRIPFLSGILVSVFGIYLRYFCEEDDSFLGHHHHGVAKETKNPLMLALKPENLRQLLAACFIPTLWSGGFYLVFVWMAVFMTNLIPSDPFTVNEAFGINSLSLLLSVCVLFPVAGVLSDWYGRRLTMTIGGILFGLGSPFLVTGIGQGHVVLAFVCQSVLGTSLSLWSAPMMAWLVESFPSEARLTSVAIGYNIGQAASGGISPALATYMVDRYGYLSPRFLLTFLSMIALFGLWIIAPRPPPEPPVPSHANLKDETTQLLRNKDTTETYRSESTERV